MKLTHILLASTFAFATVTTFAAQAESTATEQEKWLFQRRKLLLNLLQNKLLHNLHLKQVLKHQLHRLNNLKT